MFDCSHWVTGCPWAHLLNLIVWNQNNINLFLTIIFLTMAMTVGLPLFPPDTSLRLPENHEATSCGQGSIVPGPEQEHPIFEQHLIGRVLPRHQRESLARDSTLASNLATVKEGQNLAKVLSQSSESDTHYMDRWHFQDAPDVRPDSSVVSPLHWWALSRPLRSD